MAVEDGDTDGENSDKDMDFFEKRRYKKTKPKNWTMHENGRPGRVIHPILFTGPAKFFRPNISDEKLKGIIDAHGDIRFSKVFEWTLPKFDGETFYEFLSARMRNFIVYAIKTKIGGPVLKFVASNNVSPLFPIFGLTVVLKIFSFGALALGDNIANLDNIGINNSSSKLTPLHTLLHVILVPGERCFVSPTEDP